MIGNNIIVTDINCVKTDRLNKGSPFIPVAPRTWHALAFMTGGQLRYDNGETTHIVSEGEVTFIRSGSVDISEAYQCDSTSFICFDFRTLSNEFSFPGRFSFSAPVRERLRRQFEETLAIWRSGLSCKKTKCLEKIYSILTMLLDEIFESNRDSYRYRKIAPAVEFINNHCLEANISCERVSALTGMSAASLNRLFKSLYGMTMKSYITEKRVENAKSMLMNSTNSVGKISAACGFTDVYTFSHLFRRVTGCSPSDWRVNELKAALSSGRAGISSSVTYPDLSGQNERNSQ